MIHPIIFKENGELLIVDSNTVTQLIKNPKQILWIRDGVYGIISIEIVQNKLDIHVDANTERIEIGWVPRLNIAFDWSDAIEIPESTGIAMAKANGNGQ